MYTASQEEQEQEQEEEQDKNDLYPFEQFWEMYLKKGSRVKAVSSFEKLKDSEKQLLFTFIPKFIENHKDAGKMEYLPHFSTFINQLRWKDELPYQIIKPIEISTNKLPLATL
jgi:hypothetical protein